MENYKFAAVRSTTLFLPTRVERKTYVSRHTNFFYSDALAMVFVASACLLVSGLSIVGMADDVKNNGKGHVE